MGRTPKAHTLFFFLNGDDICKFPGQGSNPHHSCGNTRSFNPLGQVGGRTLASTATGAAAVRFLAHGTTAGTALFFWLLLRYVDTPGPGIELQLPAYATATATATPDPSHVCDPYHSQILNPLSKARNQTCNLMVPSWFCFHCTTMGIPIKSHPFRVHS